MTRHRALSLEGVLASSMPSATTLSLGLSLGTIYHSRATSVVWTLARQLCIIGRGPHSDLGESFASLGAILGTTVLPN